MGSIPVLRTFSEEAQEASFIAIEIKRLVAGGGGMLGWGDFVVLCEFVRQLYVWMLIFYSTVQCALASDRERSTKRRYFE
jgi:hypothetical protein